MIEKNKFELISNKLGETFHEKWEEDSRKSLSISAPMWLAICSVCFSMIVGFSIKLLFIMILPVIVIGASFIYVPLFSRRPYMNGLVKRMIFDGNKFTIETYKWLNFQSIKVSLESDSLILNRFKDEPLFDEKRVWLIKSSERNLPQIYIVEDFLDGPIELLISNSY